LPKRKGFLGYLIYKYTTRKDSCGSRVAEEFLKFIKIMDFKRIIIVFVFFLISCVDRSENIVNVNELNKLVYVGMHKEELLKKIGNPKDSLVWGNAESKNYYFIYDTNDLSGYTLKVIFNERGIVQFYRLD
jgi:hypothetical protein